MPGNIEAFLILIFLLPGFVGLIAYDIVAEIPRREIFDRVVIALGVTVIATVTYRYFGSPVEFGKLVADGANRGATLNEIVANLGVTTAIAIAYGVASGAFQNWGVLHWILKFLHLTKRTGAIDVWHQVFSRGESCWVQVRYKNGNLLIGWAKYYSEDSKTMALFLASACWSILDSQTGNFTDEAVNGPGVLITNFADVVSIEMLQ